MKKGLKKFLGVMTVYSILGGSACIGASALGSNYCGGVKPVSAASVPGITNEDVKAMNAFAEFVFLLQEMWNTEPSQWGNNFLFRFKKSRIILDTYKGDIRWEEWFSKNEFWKRADAVAHQLFDKEFPSNKEKEKLLKSWLVKHNSV